jgi:hypothetical protein
VLFALPARPLSGSIVAYGPDTRTVLAGTVLNVRLDRALDTARNHVGDGFYGVLETPVVVAGRVAIPKGAGFRGRIATVRPGGFLKGKASLAVILDSFELRNKTYAVATSPHAVAGAKGWRPVHLPGGYILRFSLSDSVRL